MFVLQQPYKSLVNISFSNIILHDSVMVGYHPCRCSSPGYAPAPPACRRCAALAPRTMPPLQASAAAPTASAAVGGGRHSRAVASGPRRRPVVVAAVASVGGVRRTRGGPWQVAQQKE